MKMHLSHSLLIILALLFATTSMVAPPAFAEAPSPADEVNTTTPTSEMVAYYFHGNMRCATCRKLEAYSEEAITRGFSKELASGDLAWRVVNTDDGENSHFVDDFELVTRSLVLVEYRNGEVERFENLKLIWQLVRDKDGFLKYVRDATGEFIEEN